MLTLDLCLCLPASDRDLSPRTHFLPECIFDAGAVRGPVGKSANHRVHSIQGVFISVNFMKNLSLKTIHEAACWKQNFASFY